ncbi:antitoxin FitA [Gammaproteobacteria bacterium]
METLILRDIPTTLYQRLKTMAEAHHHSVSQEALHVLEIVLSPLDEAPKPSVEETLNWLRMEVWTLPVLDNRNPDEIMGYNEHGLFD